jgi:putative transcriptional regulator
MEDHATHPDPGFLKGHFVIAMPGLADPNFEMTVTCICEHSSEGALGVMVNRILPELKGKDLFKELKLEYNDRVASVMPVYFGGPVHTHEIFILHGPPFEWVGCLKVTPFLALSNTLDILKAIAMGKGPDSYLIALGCAGWGPGQLENEILQNSWVTTPALETLIFSRPVDDRWKGAMGSAGIDPTLLSHSAGNA